MGQVRGEEKVLWKVFRDWGKIGWLKSIGGRRLNLVDWIVGNSRGGGRRWSEVEKRVRSHW